MRTPAELHAELTRLQRCTTLAAATVYAVLDLLALPGIVLLVYTLATLIAH